MTVEGILAIDTFGVMSLFDLGVALEQIALGRGKGDDADRSEDADKELAFFVEWLTDRDSPVMSRPIDLDKMESQAKKWPKSISESDPRFASVLKETPWRSVRDVLNPSTTGKKGDRYDALVLLDNEVERIRGLSLEDQIHDVVSAVGGRSVADRVEQLGMRWGTTGQKPSTLEEVGNRIGVTRERVRQLEMRIRERLPQTPFVPALDIAIAALQEAAPIPISQVSAVVSSAVESNVDYCWEAIRSVADLLHREVDLEDVEPVRGQRLVVSADASSVFMMRSTHKQAIKQSLAYGATNFEEVEYAVRENAASPVDCELIQNVLSSTNRITIRPDGWLWYHPEDRRSSFAERSKLMLAVNQPLAVRSLRDGLRRRAAFLDEPLVPPTDVLAAVYESLPAFALDGDLVSSIDAVDGLVNEAEVKWKMVRILESAPEQIMDRVSFLEACQRADINLNTANVYLTYLAEIEHVAPNVWAARGTPVDTGAIVALQERAGSSAPPESTTGWTKDGRPWLAVRITPTTWSSGVFHVPAELEVLRGSSFEAFNSAGAAVGTVAVNETGNSWGWSTYMRRTGAEVGDVLRGTFDIVERVVTVEIGNIVLLE